MVHLNKTKNLQKCLREYMYIPFTNGVEQALIWNAVSLIV